MYLAKIRSALFCAILLCELLLPAYAPAQVLVIKNVNLFDGENYLENVNVVCVGSRIKKITRRATRTRKALTIDGTGKTILPPLVNAHVHAFSPDHLQAAQKVGVFAVLDMHTSPSILHYLRTFKDSVSHARFYSSGPGATVPGGHGTQFGIEVPTINDSLTPRRFVEDRIKEDVDYIKILLEPAKKTLSARQTKEIIEVAHRNGRMAVAHVSRLRDALMLASQDVNGFVHIWIDKSATQQQLDSLRLKKAFIVPTLAVQEKLLELAEKQGWARHVLTFEKVLEETKRAYNSGIPILAGTDAPNFEINYGDAFFSELILLSRAGIQNIEVLKSATSNVYKAFKLDEFGPLREGSPASFILINGNPLDQIEDVRKVESIWKGGLRIN